MDRVADVSRYFQAALDVGCGRGHIAKVMSGDLIGSLYQCDMAEQALVSIIIISDTSGVWKRITF